MTTAAVGCRQRILQSLVAVVFPVVLANVALLGGVSVANASTAQGQGGIVFSYDRPVDDVPSQAAGPTASKGRTAAPAPEVTGRIFDPNASLVAPRVTPWLDDAATAKVPSGWGPGRPNIKGVGTRWTDPANQGNGIRIDQGNPLSTQVSQQVDHVVVRSGGEVIGRDGRPIVGSIKDNYDMAHIPLDEWLTWSSWNSP